LPEEITIRMGNLIKILNDYNLPQCIRLCFDLEKEKNFVNFFSTVWFEESQKGKKERKNARKI